jgi:hypothetical protein
VGFRILFSVFFVVFKSVDCDGMGDSHAQLILFWGKS